MIIQLIKSKSGLFSLGNERLSVLVDVGAENFPEFLLEDLDFEPVEVVEGCSFVLFLDFVTQTRTLELFVQLVFRNFLSVNLTSTRFVFLLWQHSGF